MKIRIIACEQNKFVIEPIKDKNSYHSHDLSIELGGLKKELALNELDLIEGRDYLVDKGEWPSTKPDYHLKFAGKSQVLRGLFTIPLEWIDFEQSNFYPKLTKQDLIDKRSKFALSISDRECAIHELPFVESTHSLLLKSLIEQIKAVHQIITKPSAVIKQLEADLLLINQKKNDLWGNSNFYLSCAALYHAINTENQKLTIQEGGLSFLGMGSSVLAPKYNKIFNDISNFLTNCKGYPTNYNQQDRHQFLETNYYPLVKTLEPNILSTLTI